MEATPGTDLPVEALHAIDAKERFMRSVLKSGFLWEFLGGFAVAAVALVTLHPSEAPRASVPVAQVR